MVSSIGGVLDLSRRQAAVRRGVSGPAAHDARSRPGIPGRARSGQGRMPAAGRRHHRPAYKTQTQKADETHAAALARIEQRKQNDLQRADDAYPQRLADLAAWRDRTHRARSRKSIRPCSARSRSIIAPSRSGFAPDMHQRGGGEPAAIRARVERRWPSAGGRAWSGSARRPRRSNGPVARRFPIGTQTTGPAGRRRRRFRRSFRSATAGSSWPRSRTACPRTSGCGRRGSSSRCRCCCPIRGVRCCC